MPPKPASEKRQRLRAIIRDKSLLKEGDFRLASGQASNYFFDLKKTAFDPEGAALLADLLFERIREEDVDCVGGLETGAIPIVSAVCRRSWPEKPVKGFFVRKAGKGHGTDKMVDGHLERGARVILFEDVTTTGGSVMQAVREARAQGCDIVKIVAVVDRQEGARQHFAAEGLRFEALFTRADFT
jgi:orotate phosphoribosyltransferase